MAKLGEFGYKLDSMTEQEVFNVAAEHLLTQMKKSMKDKNNNLCQYSCGDLYCAAAPFIKNYVPEMEGQRWSDIVLSFDLSYNCKDLIFELQIVHDDYEPDEWQNQLVGLAAIYKLDDSSARREYI